VTSWEIEDTVGGFACAVSVMTSVQGKRADGSIYCSKCRVVQMVGVVQNILDIPGRP